VQGDGGAFFEFTVADLAWFQLMSGRAIPIPATMSSPNGPSDMDNRSLCDCLDRPAISGPSVWPALSCLDN
jgi:hypothetical protein